MLGRTLFSLCVVAVLAIQSCVVASAPVVQDGIYRILNRGRGYLTSPGQEKGSPVFLADQSSFLGSQEWEVRNQDDGLVMIRNLANGYYLAPIDPRNIRFREIVVQSDRGFPWDVQYDFNNNVYHITTHRPHNRLRLGAPPQDFPPLVDFEYSSPVPEQEWEFLMVGNARHQTLAHCRGPWRFSRHELYLE